MRHPRRPRAHRETRAAAEPPCVDHGPRRGRLRGPRRGPRPGARGAAGRAARTGPAGGDRRLRPPTPLPRLGPARCAHRRGAPVAAQGWGSRRRPPGDPWRHGPLPAAGRRRARRTRGEGRRRVRGGGALGLAASPRGPAAQPSQVGRGRPVRGHPRPAPRPGRTRTAIVGAEGEGRVAVVRTAALDPDGRPLPGTERRIEADTVGVGWGFVPSSTCCSRSAAASATRATAPWPPPSTKDSAPRCRGCTRRARPAAWAGPRSR
ncbi:protein of unknown function [Streptomyces sp. KY70]|nr:protein of unknown function [Streptomyces sp. KY70]